MVHSSLNDTSSFSNSNPAQIKPEIYVACLASYNNGILYGDWVDMTKDLEVVLETIQELLARSPIPNAEEIAIHDYQGFGSLRIDEYEDIVSIHAKAAFITEHGTIGVEVAAYYNGDLEAAQDALENYYQGEYESDLDYAMTLFDECYLPHVPDNVQCYIDYDKFKRDIFICDCFSIQIEGSSHIFMCH